MKKIIFATNNKKKLEEVRSLLKNQYEVLSLEDINCLEDIEETEDTIEGNAKLKADYVTNKYGYSCFSDDSGLLIDSLNGEPGVFSARYAGEPKNDTKNLNLVLKNLGENTNRNAHFKTVIALNYNGNQFLFEGIINGSITLNPIGENGFGYDPIFIPENYNKTFAQMTMKEKSEMSHRGIAVKKLIEFLKNN